MEDERVQIEVGDVADRIRAAAPDSKRFDCIALDLYEGPHQGRKAKLDPFFGEAALKATRKALNRGGTFALWSEHRDAQFEKRLEKSGFEFEIRRPGKGGLRHAVYAARAH